MNCLDFRRAAGIDPRQPGEEARLHAADCAECRAFLERQRDMDAALFDALRVPAPDGLADRILVAHGLRTPRRAWFVALAASVVFASALAILWPRAEDDPLGREAIAHVMGEPQSFTTKGVFPANLLAGALASQGMRLAVAVGTVTYENLCPMAGGTARHLVVDSGGGSPVTVFLAAQAPRPAGRSVTRDHGMVAITLPAARGAITIVASSLAQAMAVEHAFVSA